MKILLHICCAPCLIYPLEKLKAEGFCVTGFFYNPNIHPFSEYQKRKEATLKLSQDENLKIHYPAYRIEEYFGPLNQKVKTLQRCPLCFSLRLKKTAQTAKQGGFSYFSTTLLVSPYQDQELLKKIGDEIAKEEKIEFYSEDFRPGFKITHQQAHQKGIYCQKYCGCLYSQVELCRKS